jgi:hypothetical protein
MYINVIYFFAMHEICVHTVFEPSAKKTPSLLFMFCEEKLPRQLYNIIADEGFLLCTIISTECVLCASAHCSIIHQIFCEEHFFPLHNFVADVI